MPFDGAVSQSTSLMAKSSVWLLADFVKPVNVIPTLAASKGFFTSRITWPAYQHHALFDMDRQGGTNLVLCYQAQRRRPWIHRGTLCGTLRRMQRFGSECPFRKPSFGVNIGVGVRGIDGTATRRSLKWWQTYPRAARLSDVSTKCVADTLGAQPKMTSRREIFFAIFEIFNVSCISGRFTDLKNINIARF